MVSLDPLWDWPHPGLHLLPALHVSTLNGWHCESHGARANFSLVLIILKRSRYSLFTRYSYFGKWPCTPLGKDWGNIYWIYMSYVAGSFLKNTQPPLWSMGYWSQLSQSGNWWYSWDRNIISNNTTDSWRSGHRGSLSRLAVNQVNYIHPFVNG